MIASVPAPIANAIQLALPLDIAVAIAARLRNGPSASTENPNSFGNLLISTTSAIPFM